MLKFFKPVKVDHLMPSSEPAASIYKVFAEESKKREGRSVDEWMEAELEAVFQESVRQANRFGLNVPTKEEVEQAEMRAMGSADYAAKWAYRIVDIMHKNTGRS